MALRFDLATFQMLKDAPDNYYKAKITILHNLSESYIKLGMFDKSLNVAQEALEISKKYNNNEEILTSISYLTDIYRHLKKYSEAMKLDQKAYEISRELYGENSIKNLQHMTSLAHDYYLLKNYKIAIKLYKNILSQYEIIYGSKHSQTLSISESLANVYFNTSNYEKAIEIYEKVLNNLDSNIETNVLDIKYYLGLAYLLDKRNNVEDYKKGSKLIIDFIVKSDNLRNKFYLLSDEEKQKWFSDTIKKYKNIQSLYFSSKQYDNAFQTAELCKARNLIDKYAFQVYYKNILTEEEINKLNDYQLKIKKYDERIKEAIANEIRINLEFEQKEKIKEFNDYNMKLKAKFLQYNKNLSEKNSPLYVKESRLLIPENSCFIEFLLNGNYFFVFALNKTGDIQAIKIPLKDNLLEKCKLYRKLIAYPNIENMRSDNKYLWKLTDGTYKVTNDRQSPATGATAVKNTSELINLRQKLSTQLGEKLLQPLESHLSQKTNWIISPDGELNNIPFETLQFNNKTVIESIDVSYVPSLAVLKLMKEQETKNSSLKNRKGLFAMGDAVYGNSDAAASRGSLIDFSQNIRSTNDKIATVDLTQLKWSNLPGTGKELDQVSTVFNDKEIIRGRNASETNLKTLNKNGNLSEYKYLLFAAHGLFVPERPELSSIVLSQGLDKNNDGYVTVGEWMGYNLNSDLVYLSACESGLGEYQAGEGIVGIPYALTVAGNKDTVMSLWKVNDEATAEFSASFFKKLSEGQSEVKALNDTKREFLSSQNAKFNSPSVWAAFLLYGI